MSKQSLVSGLDSKQQTELGDLKEIEVALHTYDSYKPDSELLFKQLQPLLVKPSSRNWLSRMKLAHAQLSLVLLSFWWASALLLLLGAGLTLGTQGAMAVLYALCSPVLGAIGTAYIFRPEARSLREFELLSAVQPLELLYTRLLLLLGYNAVMTVTLILLAWSQDVQWGLWRLVVIWFGPMVGLTGIALYSSLRWNVVIGTLLPFGLWTLMILFGWWEATLQVTMSQTIIEVLTMTVTQSNTLLIASGVTLFMGLFLITKSGRLMENIH